MIVSITSLYSAVILSREDALGLHFGEAVALLAVTELRTETIRSESCRASAQ
jgi:hypothetical protein